MKSDLESPAPADDALQAIGGRIRYPRMQPLSLAAHSQGPFPTCPPPIRARPCSCISRERRSDVWKRLRRVLARILQPAPASDRPELRSANARARFWSELRDGEREAESASQPDRSTAAVALPVRRPQET